MTAHGWARRWKRIDESTFSAVVDSFSAFELEHPDVVKVSTSRLRRIARGSGHDIAAVRLIVKSLVAARVAAPTAREMAQSKREMGTPLNRILQRRKEEHGPDPADRGADRQPRTDA